MQTTTTITSKFQLYLPAAIRQAVGLTKHGPVTIKAQKNNIIIEPPKKNASFLSLGGKFRVKNPLPAEKIRDTIDYVGTKR